MSRHIVLFDGDCYLCNYSVQFIIKRDQKQIFKFAAIQSPEGISLLAEFGIQDNIYKTVYYIEDKNLYIESDAALKIAKHLKPPVSFFSHLIYFPKFLRDPIYKFVSKTRYKIFGRSKTCWLPSKELSQKKI